VYNNVRQRQRGKNRDGAMFNQYFFDPIWPGPIVIVAGVIGLFGNIAGLIGGIATSGNSYPDSHLEQNLRGYQTATPARRLGGSLLDGVLLVVTLVIGWFIWFAIVAPRGQTPGKSLVGTYVVRADGSRAGGWFMWGREAGVKWLLMYFIDIFAMGLAQMIGSLMILWDRDKQCLWDKIVNSYVAYSPDGPPGVMAAVGETETRARLRELQELHSDGVITSEEYENRRRRLMGEP